MNEKNKSINDFILLEKNERFMGLIGPWYYKEINDSFSTTNAQRILGIRVEERHTNILGFAHGGLLVTMADSALGYTLSRVSSPPHPTLTASLNSNFLSTAKVGDFIESHVNIIKVGSRLRFGECELKVNNRIIFKCSGVFATINKNK